MIKAANKLERKKLGCWVHKFVVYHLFIKKSVLRVFPIGSTSVYEVVKNMLPQINPKSCYENVIYSFQNLFHH